MSTTTDVHFECDAPDCQKESHESVHSSEDREFPRCPVNWLTDMSYKFHACSAEHARIINDWHVEKTGRRLLWLTFKEAPLTGAPRGSSRP